MNLTNLAQKAVLELLARQQSGVAAETLYNELSAIGSGHVAKAVRALWRSGHIKKIDATYQITDKGQELARHLELI